MELMQVLIDAILSLCAHSGIEFLEGCEWNLCHQVQEI